MALYIVTILVRLGSTCPLYIVVIFTGVGESKYFGDPLLSVSVAKGVHIPETNPISNFR